MHISDGSVHFHLSRDPPLPYIANTTYTPKQPRQISVSFSHTTVIHVFTPEI